MTKKKSIREKIDEADRLSMAGDYKGSLALLGKVLINPEGATTFEMTRISDIVEFSIEKLIDIAHSKMESTVG